MMTYQWFVIVISAMVCFINMNRLKQKSTVIFFNNITISTTKNAVYYAGESFNGLKTHKMSKKSFYDENMKN